MYILMYKMYKYFHLQFRFISFCAVFFLETRAENPKEIH